MIHARDTLPTAPKVLLAQHGIEGALEFRTTEKGNEGFGFIVKMWDHGQADASATEQQAVVKVASVHFNIAFHGMVPCHVEKDLGWF